MSFVSFFPSAESQKRWRKHMKDHYSENYNIRPCVFRIPDNLRETKPKAYIPQVVGLGPYHHFQPEVQLMTSKKPDVVNYILKDADVAKLKELFNKSTEQGVEKSDNKLVKEFETIIRLCYDRYLDLDEETLSWIVIVDGIFLWYFIENYVGLRDAEKRGAENEKQQLSEKLKISSDVEKFVPDVLMLENQIPSILILKMRMVFGLAFNVPADHKFINTYYQFCTQHSPLELSEKSEIRQTALEVNNHMLHFMYQLIMKNKCLNHDQLSLRHQSEAGTSGGATPETSDGDRGWAIAGMAADHVGELWDHVVGEFNSALEKAQKAGVKVPENVQKVSQLLQKFEQTFLLQHNKKVFPEDKIEIPSAYRLFAILHIQFLRLPKGCGIENIALEEVKGGKYKYKFSLPVIYMRANSEVILRNLVAYEAAISKQELGSTRLKDYVDLMCGLIKSEKDVWLLKKAKIIEEIPDVLPDEEIVKICNGIKKSDEKPDNKSKVHKTVGVTNKHYNDSRYVMCWRGFMKFVAFMVKYFGLLFPFLIFILLAFQSGCEIFDCRVRVNGGAAMQNHYLGNSSESDPGAKLMQPRKLLPY